MLHIVLFQPEIPANTGNIIRLCANIGARLHLIEPLGFVMEDKKLRRAGLDYHEWAEVRRHADLQACRQILPLPWFALTTKGQCCYCDAPLAPDAVLLFGSETRGLPPEVLASFTPAQRLCLPMRPTSRSLNLSNAVAVTAFEAWRQQGFQGSRELQQSKTAAAS